MRCPSLKPLHNVIDSGMSAMLTLSVMNKVEVCRVSQALASESDRILKGGFQSITVQDIDRMMVD